MGGCVNSLPASGISSGRSFPAVPCETLRPPGIRHRHLPPAPRHAHPTHTHTRTHTHTHTFPPRWQTKPSAPSPRGATRTMARAWLANGPAIQLPHVLPTPATKLPALLGLHGHRQAEQMQRDCLAKRRAVALPLPLPLPLPLVTISSLRSFKMAPNLVI